MSSNTHQCPTCKGRKKIIVCDDCLSFSCAEGNIFCENYRNAGFKEVPCPKCAKKKPPTLQVSKEPQQPKENKLERIRKICYTANYDNHKYPDERSILVAIHDVIYEDCKDCRRKRDLCHLHTPSKEDTECTCKRVIMGQGLSREETAEEIRTCPLHGSSSLNHAKEESGPIDRVFDRALKETE